MSEELRIFKCKKPLEISEFATSKIPQVFFLRQEVTGTVQQCRKANISRWFATPSVVSVSVDHFGKN